MTNTSWQDEFDKFLHKAVRCKGIYFPGAKDFSGMCTAALYDWHGDGTSLIAIMASGYEPGVHPEKWIRFDINNDTLVEGLADFEILTTSLELEGV